MNRLKQVNFLNELKIMTIIIYSISKRVATVSQVAQIGLTIYRKKENNTFKVKFPIQRATCDFINVK